MPRGASEAGGVAETLMSATVDGIARGICSQTSVLELANQPQSACFAKNQTEPPGTRYDPILSDG